MGPSQAIVGNRLLAALRKSDYAGLQPAMETVALEPTATLIAAHQAILHVYFPESGLVSAIAETAEGRIEIGMIGREGMVGLAIVLGAESTPHVHLVQGAGKALRVPAHALREAIVARPTTFRPFGLFAQAFTVQVGQTAYANASYSIDARLARWILMTQDRVQSDELLLTHEFLATMLGVRRTGVTSAAHLLEGIGAIRAGRGRITVLDRDKLISLADDSYQVAENEYERLISPA